MIMKASKEPEYETLKSLDSHRLRRMLGNLSLQIDVTLRSWFDEDTERDPDLGTYPSDKLNDLEFLSDEIRGILRDRNEVV